MKNKGYFEFAKYGSIGISWVLSTAVYLYLGIKGGTYLDARFGTSPTFLLLGLFGGVALSLRMLITEILKVVGPGTNRAERNTSALGEGDQGSRCAVDREKSNKNPQEPES